MKAKSKRPDPEQFSRVVLWHLCSLQAEIQLLKADIIYEQGKAKDASDAEILKLTATHAKRARKRSELMYEEALRQSNIKPSPSYPSPAVD